MKHVPPQFWAMDADAFDHCMRTWSIASDEDIATAEQLAAAAAPVVTVHGNGVAIMSLSGPSFKGSAESVYYGGFSTVAYANALDAIANDPTIAGVVLAIDSHGGEAAGQAHFGDRIAALNARKPVVAFIEDYGQSAAYWSASQTSRIIAGRSAAVGSIGVIGAMYDFSSIAERIGIRAIPIRSRPLKAPGGVMGERISDEQVAEVQRHVSDLHEIFASAVARGRDMRVKYERGGASDRRPVPDDGRSYIAEEALDLGLIDEIGTLDTAVAAVTDLIARRRAIALQRSEENDRMNIREMLGLAEDASDEQIEAAFAAVKDKALAADARTTELVAKIDSINSRIDAIADERVNERVADSVEQKAKTDFVAGLIASGHLAVVKEAAALRLATGTGTFDDFRAIVENVNDGAPVRRVVEQRQESDPVSAGGSMRADDPRTRAFIDREANALVKSDRTLSYAQAVDIVVAKHNIR